VNTNMNLIVEDERINQNSTSNLFDLKNINIEIKNRSDSMMEEKSNTFINPLAALNGNNSLNAVNASNTLMNDTMNINNIINNNPRIDNVGTISGEKTKKKIVPTMISKN
jgi:hypothetical protein